MNVKKSPRARRHARSPVHAGAAMAIACVIGTAMAPVASGAGPSGVDGSTPAVLSTQASPQMATASGPSVHTGGYPARVRTNGARTLNLRQMPFQRAPRVKAMPNRGSIRVYCQTSRFDGRWYLVRHGSHMGYAMATFIQNTSNRSIQPCSLQDYYLPLGRQMFAAKINNQQSNLLISATPSKQHAVIAPPRLYDASWTTLTGWLDGKSSLESWYYPGYYLRHQDYRVKLHTPFTMRARDIPLFRLDSSFNVRTGDPGGWIRFQSVNYPDRYIRHYRGVVEVSSQSFRPRTPYHSDVQWLMR